ncbi:hypothetical protein ACH4SP_03605 [Streptomyces sp. NPDC021093]|uniref:hypothetical protein n=1 Tax=Streptomyces sp. NPDC021093 TaxID=3365112 RepID=UPI00378C367B
MIPAGITALTAAAGYAGRVREAVPPVWQLGYVLPLCLLVAVWVLAARDRQRAAVWSAGLGAFLCALLYGKAVMAVAYALALALWLVQGD